jgi:Tol biopolymer transport system component
MSKQGGATGIVIRMLDGSYRTFRKPATGEAIDPVIAPDGSRMAFARCDHHAWNIFETSLDSNPAVRRVTNDPCYNLYPAYAADRKQLLFNHVELQQGREKGVAEPSWKLCSADLETSVLTEYGDGFSPSYAPGKNRAVAVRLNDSTQTTELWLIDLATGARSRLFGKPGQGVADPAVSPDGKVVAFVTMTEDSNTPANLDIYTMNMDGSSLTRRTFFPGQDLCPRWSGDGNSLYFLSQRNTESGEWNVWKMDLTGIPAAGAATDAKVQPASPVPVKPAVKEPSPPAPNSALQKSAVPAESPAQGGSLADTAKISPPPPPHDSTTQGGK